jgi:hypothetical protein
VPSTSCPKCGRQIRIEIHDVHRVIECVACAQRFTPSGGPVEDRPAPASPEIRLEEFSAASASPAPPRLTTAPPAPQRSVSVAPRPRVSSYTPEPWYYGFIAKYATVWMWFGIILIALLFVLWTVATVIAAERDARALVLLPVLAACAVLGILSVMFAAALYLLAVDAGRKLRSIDQKMDERT